MDEHENRVCGGHNTSADVFALCCDEREPKATLRIVFSEGATQRKLIKNESVNTFLSVES